MSNTTSGNEMGSEEGLLVFVGRHAKAVGKDLAEHAFKLWYTVQADATPTIVKAPLIAALFYVGCPVDAIPDVVPFVGFADDLVVVGVGLAAAHAYITDDIVVKAKTAVRCIFG